jgi:hypothetical protein
MAHRRLFGGCLCGSVRYEITALPGTVEHCHCTMCRKAHGAAFSTNALVPSDALTVTSGAAVISEYESSPNRRKCFCARCGSQLVIRRLDGPALTVVTPGTIDGDPVARPAPAILIMADSTVFSSPPLGAERRNKRKMP